MDNLETQRRAPQRYIQGTFGSTAGTGCGKSWKADGGGQKPADEKVKCLSQR